MNQTLKIKSVESQSSFFKKDFLMSTIFNGYIEFVTILLLFYVCLFVCFCHETCGILVPPKQGSKLQPPALEVKS